MTGRVVLAVSGSNLTGDAPFSAALATAAGAVHAAASPPGARGDLARLVAEVCATAGVAPAAIAALRVDVGPGSYTGLRVALTFARFLQRFGGVAVHAVDSLALLAARAPGDASGPPRRVHALLDARRERVHLQSFDLGAAGVVARGPAAAVPLAAALAACAPGELVVAPAALPTALAAAFAAHGAVVHAAAGIVAAELLAPTLPFAPADFAALEPRYLMGSYAED